MQLVEKGLTSGYLSISSLKKTKHVSTWCKLQKRGYINNHLGHKHLCGSHWSRHVWNECTVTQRWSACSTELTEIPISYQFTLDHAWIQGLRWHIVGGSRTSEYHTLCAAVRDCLDHQVPDNSQIKPDVLGILLPKITWQLQQLELRYHNTDVKTITIISQ